MFTSRIEVLIARPEPAALGRQGGQRGVDEHEPPTRMKVESTSGPFPTTLEFQFAGRDGGTQVNASVTGRPTGSMRVLQPMIARTTQKNLDRGYARLKTPLETGTAAQLS